MRFDVAALLISTLCPMYSRVAYQIRFIYWNSCDTFLLSFIIIQVLGLSMTFAKAGTTRVRWNVMVKACCGYRWSCKFQIWTNFFLLTLSFAILVWDIMYVTALSPLSDQHFDSHSSHKGDDQNAAKRRKANSANTVWTISKLRLKDEEFVPNIRSKYYQIPTFETW